jgi:isopentenyl-diphosphate Delta-isomerase
MLRVILVDEKDNPIGLEEKLKAHKDGFLHRAISVYIFNSKKELMMQRRADGVYHSGSLWSNTCCSNCYEGENAKESAHRSLNSEMGFDCDLKESFSTIYKTDVGGGLIEHEFLHVFFGKYDKDPIIKKDEVSDWKFMQLDDLEKDIKNNPSIYTAWLKILVENSVLYKNARAYLNE